MRVTASLRFTQEFHIHTVLEHHHDVDSAEKEIPHGVPFLNDGADLQAFLPVAGADLGHADGQHRHQPVFLCIDDDTVAGFDHLPPGDRVDQNIPVLFRMPHGDAARAVHGRNLAELDDPAADREMIPVIIVHIQERMGQRASFESVMIGGIRADQLGTGPLGTGPLETGPIDYPYQK